MEQNPSKEANSHSANQDIPRFLWKPKVHFRVKNSANGPYTEPDEYSPHIPTLFP